jgi:hypothetical protein
MVNRIVALGFLVAVIACTPRDTFTDRVDGVPLMLGAFRSYSTERQVRSSLDSLPVEVVERSGLSEGDARPAHTVVTLRVPAYRHVGYTGQLHLTLFNDRLMTASFYPSDVPGYVMAIKRQGIDVTTNLTAGLHSDNYREPLDHVRVWVSSDYQGREYVGWSDSRLEEQSRRWIERYSHLDRWPNKPLQATTGAAASAMIEAVGCAVRG